MPAARCIAACSLVVALGCTNDYQSFSEAPSGASAGGAPGSVSSTGPDPGSGAVGGAASASDGATTVGTGGAPPGTGGSPGTGGVAGCGDGIVQLDEECDDQNADPADGCAMCVCDLFEPSTHHCYHLVTSGSWTWADARSACPPGWELASLETIGERDFVIPLLAGLMVGVWIGASDTAVEGSFEWLSGQPFTYTDRVAPWKIGEPNDFAGAEDCVEMWWDNGDGIFNDAGCDGPKTVLLCELTQP